MLNRRLWSLSSTKLNSGHPLFRLPSMLPTPVAVVYVNDLSVQFPVPYDSMSPKSLLTCPISSRNERKQIYSPTIEIDIHH